MRPEIVFSALIALDHAFIMQTGSAHERLAAARTFHGGLQAWRRTFPTYRRAQHAAPDALARWIALVERRRARLREPLVGGCLLALEQALVTLGGTQDLPLPAPPRPVPHRAALRQALRQATGVLLVYFAAGAFHLGYPYWGSMAVVVVLQKGTRVTWMRALERICGSLVGGVGAALLLHIAWPAPLVAALCVVLAALAIALRSVNYTSFVVFLTVLFVTVTALLHPGEGIPMARIADNTVGSLVALLSVLTVWPERRPRLRATLKAALQANRAYLDAVESHAPRPAFRQHGARRGWPASIWNALHDPGWIVQVAPPRARGSGRPCHIAPGRRTSRHALARKAGRRLALIPYPACRCAIAMKLRTIAERLARICTRDSIVTGRTSDISA
jgi:uncharacterized membrane protein YccC